MSLSDPIFRTGNSTIPRPGALFSNERGFVSPDGEVMLTPEQLRDFGETVQRFMVQYEFGLREIETKITILRDEFLLTHDYNPIEHVSSRVKSFESLADKLRRRGLSFDLETVRESITDIAGVRITCAFVRDVYHLFDLLTSQSDVTVREVKDYIANPKPNGYKSLHAIVEVPVFMSSGTVQVPVEIQFRSIAMDFWASLEHRIHYKFDGNVPAGLVEELRTAAETADELDTRMARLHAELHPEQATAPRRSFES